MSKKTNAQLSAELETLSAELEKTKQILAEVVEERDGLKLQGEAETIYMPKSSDKTVAVHYLLQKLAKNDGLGDLELRGRLLATLTQRKWKATTVASIHMNIVNSQLVISIDRDIYLADKPKWMAAFGMIKGAVEGTALRYTYNNGKQYLSVREQERQAA